MQRTLATLTFCAAALFATAQSRDIKVVDTDAMRVSATKHTELVHKTVTLDADQRAKVQEVYMNYERQLDGLNQRFEIGGLSKEEREAEMAPQWASLERMVDEQLATILNPEQLGKWQEARR